MAIRWNDRPADVALPRMPSGAPPVSGARADAPSIDTGRPDVWVSPDAERIVLAHLGDARHERGGLLIGDAWADADGAVAHVRILDAVAALDATGTAVSLVMPAAVWTAAGQRLRPGMRIIGWYHGHPGLTAFFSDTDRRTQRAVFHHAWSVGWVVDPFQSPDGLREAFFIGPDSHPLPRDPTPRLPMA